MSPSLETADQKAKHVYAELTVLDGDRRLKPAEVGSDRMIFRQPPYIVSDTIEIILTNGDEQDRHLAKVLPHDADAKEIPIQLLKML